MSTGTWGIRAVSSIMAAILLAGCSPTGDSSTDSSTSAAPVVSDAAAGNKHMNAAFFWVSNTLDPANHYDGWVLSRIGAGETLVRLNMEAEVEACLAESWEQEDENTWIFHIRDGVTFSNGKPVDGKVCKAAIDRAFANNARAAEYFKPASIQANGQTLTIRTTEPCGAILNNLCEPLFTIIDTDAADADIAVAPVCTGPYVVTSYTPDVKVELAKNEHYWDGTPGLDTITVSEVADSDSRVLALQSGEVDLTNTIDNSSLELFRDENLYEIHETIGPRTNVVYMNREREFLKNRVIRQAISYAIDRETYAQLIGGVKGVGIYSPALACGEGLSDTYAYDLDQANAVLDAAGYLDTDQDSVREINGKPITLEYYLAADHGSSDAAIIAQAVQSDVQKAGIQINLMQTENMSDIKASRTYDLCSANDSTAPTGDPEVFLRLHYLSGAADNYAGYSDAETDELIQSLATIFDSDERQQQARSISQRILDDAACLYIGYIYGNTINSTKVRNAEQFPIDYYIITKDITIE